MAEVHPDTARLDVLLPDGTHRYWSTHCRHGNHDACSATTMVRNRAVDGPADAALRPVEVLKTAAQCKTCAAPCVCGCHEGGTEWAPGAGVVRMQREHPEMIPEISAEDQRKADEIIVAGNLADAVRFFRDKLAYYDRTITENLARPTEGADGPVHRMLREQAERLRVYRDHLAVLLRTLGVDVPELPEVNE